MPRNVTFFGFQATISFVGVCKKIIWNLVPSPGTQKPENIKFRFLTERGYLVLKVYNIDELVPNLHLKKRAVRYI